MAEQKDPISTQEGTFAQIQFRRKILAAGMVVTGPSSGTQRLKPANQAVTADTATKPPRPAQEAIYDLPSDPTDPVWVQFLPSRFLPVDRNQDFETLVLNADNNKGLLICDEKTPTTPIKLTHDLHPDWKDPSSYRFALLLTQEVPDLLGRRGQERFVDMLLQQAPAVGKNNYTTTDAAWNCNLPSAIEPKTLNLIARIVVIQRQVKTSTLCNPVPPYPPPMPPPPATTCASQDVYKAVDFWAELFPQDSDSTTPPERAKDATSRIIAVSPPIAAYDPKALPKSCRVDTTNQSPIPAGQGG